MPWLDYVGTNFMSSESSLSSLVGVVFIPLFLARGQPDKLKTESIWKLIKMAGEEKREKRDNCSWMARGRNIV